MASKIQLQIIIANFENRIADLEKERDELKNKINRSIEILDSDASCCAFVALQVLQKYTKAV